MPAVDFLVVGIKQGTGIGIGSIIGYGVGVVYIATGVGIIIGSGTGNIHFFGSQSSSTQQNIVIIDTETKQ